MKVLVVTNMCPWPAAFGGVIRQARLIEHLCKNNQVRVVVLDHPPSTMEGVPPKTEFIPLQHLTQPHNAFGAGWEQRYNVVRGIVNPYPELFRPLRSETVSRTFRGLRQLAAEHQVCWVSWPSFADAAMDAWPGARVVVDYIDVGALAQGSQLRMMPSNPHKFFTRIDTLKLAWHERRVAKRSWRSVVCKAEDGRFLRQPRKVFVVPNGTDPRPRLDAADEEPARLLFVGLMSFSPNVDAVHWFVGECLPLLSDVPVRLDLVGRDPPESVRKLDDGARVCVHGFAPDLIELYRRASVVVAPIRLGSGTKLKVLEALAFGKALVATSEAVAGVNVRHEVEYLRADSPIEMAAACRRLIEDPALRARLGRAGRQRVEEQYTWGRIGDLAQRVITP